ncbi:MAG: alpha/beta hydrolase [Gemmatimonadaceae bacterium]|nr:alpha/beta hydrolase [Gemmatimonadaceae bacterium]
MFHAGLPAPQDLAPPTAVPVGSLLHFQELRSRFLPQPHDVIVCLPPDYDADPTRRYPVLYLHDGQNVFDDLPLSPFGVQWGVDTTARALMHAQVIEPLILVAIGNAGRDRIDEYTPTRDSMHDAGGMADRYGQMLVYEIKPWVDRQWRTRRGPQDTGLAGSSLGGLLSLHLGLTHSAVFGKLALLSPSVWWDDRWIVRQLASSDDGRPDLRIWLDVGTGETRMLKGTRLLYRMLQRQGWRDGHDLSYHEAPGALHDERAWGERSGLFLQFLFPALRTPQAIARAMSSGMR